MIHFCKSHVIRFIISLTSFIQIFVYYILKVLLIALISISLESFFLVKFVIILVFFFQNKKQITKIKEIDFCYKEIIILNTS